MERFLKGQAMQERLDEAFQKYIDEEDAREAAGEHSDSDSDTELPIIPHVTLESIDLNSLKIDNRDEINIYNKIAVLEDFKKEFADVDGFAEIQDDAIAAIEAAKLPPPVKRLTDEELFAKTLADPRLPPFAESKIGNELKLLNVFDETMEFFTRIAMDKGQNLAIMYSCRCEAKLEAKSEKPILLHIALEHVHLPTSFEILFEFHARLAGKKKKSKKTDLICIACGHRATLMGEFVAHFSTPDCCNIHETNNKIDVDDINMENLETLIEAVDKKTFKKIMAN